MPKVGGLKMNEGKGRESELSSSIHLAQLPECGHLVSRPWPSCPHH